MIILIFIWSVHSCPFLADEFLLRVRHPHLRSLKFSLFFAWIEWWSSETWPLQSLDRAEQVILENLSQSMICVSENCFITDTVWLYLVTAMIQSRTSFKCFDGFAEFCYRHKPTPAHSLASLSHCPDLEVLRTAITHFLDLGMW